MKKIGFILISIMLTIMLNACGGSSQLVGKWEMDDSVKSPQFCDELEIFSDGTYSSDESNYSGKYSVDNNRIKFEGILVSPETFTFEVNSKTLTLYEDNEVAAKYNKISN